MPSGAASRSSSTSSCPLQGPANVWYLVPAKQPPGPHAGRRLKALHHTRRANSVLPGEVAAPRGQPVMLFSYAEHRRPPSSSCHETLVRRMVGGHSPGKLPPVRFSTDQPSVPRSPCCGRDLLRPPCSFCFQNTNDIRDAEFSNPCSRDTASFSTEAAGARGCQGARPLGWIRRASPAGIPNRSRTACS